MSHSPEQLASLAERGRALSDEIKALTEQLDEIKGVFRAELVGEKDFGEVKVNVRKSYRWNADQAAKVIPDVLMSLVTDTVITREKCQTNLPPALYDQCKVETTAAVVFEAP